MMISVTMPPPPSAIGVPPTRRPRRSSTCERSSFASFLKRIALSVPRMECGLTTLLACRNRLRQSSSYPPSPTLRLRSSAITSGVTCSRSTSRSTTPSSTSSGAQARSRWPTRSRISWKAQLRSILVGEHATLEPGDAGELVVLQATVGPEADRHAPLGTREVVVDVDAASASQATGARSFRVLFGPHNGSTRATLFVGYLPPGRAPWHYHLYDEIVWIPEGPGRVLRRDSRRGTRSRHGVSPAPSRGAYRREPEPRSGADLARYLHACRQPRRRLPRGGVVGPRACSAGPALRRRLTSLYLDGACRRPRRPPRGARIPSAARSPSRTAPGRIRRGRAVRHLAARTPRRIRCRLRRRAARTSWRR